MSQRYPSDGQGYISNQFPSIRHPNPYTHNSSNNLPPASFPPSQHLPPLSASNNTSNPTSNYNPDPFLSSRLPNLNQSTQSGHNTSTQPPTFPAYAPTASQYPSYNGLPTNAQPPPGSPPHHSHATNGIHRPSYTAAAPANIQLPKIQPAPLSNNDIKAEFIPEAKSAQLVTGIHAPSEQEPPPKHVVGSQGRRGILPSASGRPPAVGNASAPNGGKSSPALAKDSNGRYPCPHCNKPYLHAKHLKRHMLRHTGVRPYECALCHDNFSRSDILKRHFQKCSVRRGNPTGENHLAYSRANKKAKQQDEEAMAAGLHSMATDSAPGMPPYSASLESPIGLAAMDIGQPNYERQEPLANQVTRSNGMRKVNNGIGASSQRGSTTSLNTSAFDPANSTFSTGHVTPDSVTTSGAATPYTYPHEAARSNLNSPADASFNHGMGIGLGGSRMSSGSGYSSGALPHIVGQPNGRNHDLDWSSLHQYSGHDEFGNGQYHSGASTPHHSYKQEVEFQSYDWPQNLHNSKQ